MATPAHLNGLLRRRRRLSPCLANIITGVDFLPNHVVVLRITYAADDVSDYLTYRTNAGGDLYAQLPTSPGPGALHVTATDHRTDPHGACGLLWSNTEILRS